MAKLERVARYLEHADFPATKAELVRHAERQGATPEFMDDLKRNLPDRIYDGVGAIIRSYGGGGKTV